MNKAVLLSYIFILVFSISVISCKNTQSKKEITTDILVIGGTTSGTSAGISAARKGVKTLIVEETPWLGGMFTAQGVGACDGNHNLHSGIWNEFREKLRNHYGGADKVRQVGLAVPFSNLI